MIYFAQAGIDGFIKIGNATDPQKRIAALQTGCPAKIRLLHAMPGGLADERAWHARFAHIRAHGEWFEPHPDLIGEILALRKPPPKPVFVERPLSYWAPPRMADDTMTCFRCNGVGELHDPDVGDVQCPLCGSDGFLWRSDFEGCTVDPAILREFGYEVVP